MTENQVQNKRIELKYLIDADLSQEIRAWAREHLGVDSHCDDAMGDSYEVNTLYLDTPELDLFYGTSKVGKAKHRIRRYGDNATLWVETKRKKSYVVNKNRTAASEEETVSRLTNLADQSPWCGDWFAARIIERRMHPTIQVHYRRFARTSTLSTNHLRLTIDSRLQTSPANGWNVASTSDRANQSQRVSATDVEILELKFQNQMPHLFKELLRTYAIAETGFSKYRTSVKCGMGFDPVTNASSMTGNQSHAMPEEPSHA
ncbi:VTC domain protein [Novipirellula aureliae]|uniref:VTC domain protein n=1 Tax=Novipirellula aureliae TaxID=2527966 RepID=A0A5C6DG13_9BACT|nr:polyphosphate polymerase domain-containing protein [Novipirellula aureliae]TWU35730.1 VTC domain protein [Novipirellula aureliae]